MEKVKEIKKKLEILEKKAREQEHLKSDLLEELAKAEKEEREAKLGTKPQLFKLGLGYSGTYYVAAKTKEDAIKILLSNKNLKEYSVRENIETLGEQILYISDDETSFRRNY